MGHPEPVHLRLSTDGTAVIELASASGLTAAHEGHRHPVLANTYGTGMLIADAVRRGAQQIIVAAGSSATTASAWRVSNGNCFRNCETPTRQVVQSALEACRVSLGDPTTTRLVYPRLSYRRRRWPAGGGRRVR